MLTNPNEARRERARRASHRVLAFEALVAAGTVGVTNHDLMRIAGSRAGSRVQELRDEGHVITCTHVEGGLYVYRLHAESRPRPGEPGYLASLVPTASIAGRDIPAPEPHPTATTRRATAGRLF